MTCDRGLATALAAAALGLGLLSAAPLRAEDLADSVAMAVSGHPQVRGAEAGLRASERAVEVEEGAFLPSVTVSGDSGYQHTTRGQQDVDDTQGDFWRKRYRAGATQLLFDGFATGSRIDAAEARSEAALWELRRAANDVALRAIDAHLSVVLGRELVEFARANVALHQRIFGDVEEAARRGGGSNADVSQVRTRRAFAESQLRRLEGDLANAQAAYLEAVGALPAALERPTVPFDALPATLEDALTAAWKGDPSRRAAIEEARAAGEIAESTRGAFFPTVDVELAHEGRDGVSGQADFETDTTALLRLNWNLYNGGSDLAERRRALEEENRARLRVYDIDRRLREQLEVAYTDFRVAGDQVALLRDRVATADSVTEAYREQFRLRQRSILDLVDSGNELFVARVDLARTELDQVRAGYRILALLGRILPALDVGLEVQDVAAAPEPEPVPARE